MVHTDESFMPDNKKAWSSWVYNSEHSIDDNSHVSLTYWMNNLQKLNTDKNIFVTLNPHKRPSEKLIHDNYSFAHPTFDQNTIRTQNDIESIQGINGIWYCGAWLGYGFHEDGLRSAIRVAKRMKVDVPWSKEC